MNLTWIRPEPEALQASLTDEEWSSRATACAEAAFQRANELDHDHAFPDVEFKCLHECGLLAAPLAPHLGGTGLGLDGRKAQLTLDVLSIIGWGSLALGRLYEGHVNALRLIQTHGTEDQIEACAGDVRRGLIFGVWNTQGADGLMLDNEDSAGLRLRGRKIFASGAGSVMRPLVTARRHDGGLMMIVARLTESEARERSDLSGWQAHGMRASASGAFDFTGLSVERSDIFGSAEDYHAQPDFSGGAWRFCAVQLGGIERLLDCTRQHLRDSGRDADPAQLMRLGQAATAAQTARLWVEAASRRVENRRDEDAGALIAFVNLARGAVERAGLDVIELTQRSIGLQGFLRTHAAERVLRDLATYLRQPAPDKALMDAAAHVAANARPVRDLWRL